MKDVTTEEIAKNAGLYKTRYKFPLADAVILTTATDVDAQLLVTGGEKQHEEEWRSVKEIEVLKLTEYARTL